MNALNNAVGEPLHDRVDMTRACGIYLREAHFEGSLELRATHEGPGGWYSSEVLAQAVTSTPLSKRGRVEHVMFLEPLRFNPHALQTSIGAVVNIRNVHWVALRWLADTVWLLDGMDPRLRPLSWQQYLFLIKEHKDAFRIEQAPGAR